MKKALVLLCFLPLTVFADFSGYAQPKMIFGAKWIKFGIDKPVSGTCTYFHRQFKFDASTEAGKNILSILLSAKMAGKDVAVWYTPSTNPGTDEKNGCSIGSMAVANEIGIQ